MSFIDRDGNGSLPMPWDLGERARPNDSILISPRVLGLIDRHLRKLQDLVPTASGRPTWCVDELQVEPSIYVPDGIALAPEPKPLDEAKRNLNVVVAMLAPGEWFESGDGI